MAALAFDLGVDESAISRWRHGGSISLSNAARFCLVLDVSMDWLILDRGHMDLHLVFTCDVEEQNLIACLRAMSEEARKGLARFLALVRTAIYEN